MAKINFYLIHRDKLEKKKIQIKYFDKTCKSKKVKFLKTLPFAIHPNKWNPRIDKRRGIEKWVIEDNPEAEKLNCLLSDYKKRLFEIRDSLITKDDYDNDIGPSVEEVEAAFKKRINENGVFLSSVEFEQSKKIKEAVQLKDVKINIVDLIYQYIKEGGKEGNITEGTATILKNTARHTSEFQQVEKIALTLDQLTRNNFNQFKNYLLRLKEDGGAGLHNPTAKKYLSQVRTVMRHYEADYPNMVRGFYLGTYPKVKKEIVFAMYKELDILKTIDFRKKILDNYLLRFTAAAENSKSYWTSKELASIMEIHKDSVFTLTKKNGLPKEIVKVNNFKESHYDKEAVINWVKEKEWCKNKESLEKIVIAYSEVRDWYCFASEAPLRYSDLTTLDPTLSIIEAYNTDKKLIKAIRHYPVKTIKDEVLQQFPLSEYCLSIIEKYKYKVTKNQLLPIRHSNTKMNAILHKVLKLSGLFDDEIIIKKRQGKNITQLKSPRWKELSFHTSRHTYGTNMAMQGESLLKIMRALGHTSLSTTQIYMEVVDDDFYSSVLNKFKNQPKSKLIPLKNIQEEKSLFNNKEKYRG